MKNKNWKSIVLTIIYIIANILTHVISEKSSSNPKYLTFWTIVLYIIGYAITSFINLTIIIDLISSLKNINNVLLDSKESHTKSYYKKQTNNFVDSTIFKIPNGSFWIGTAIMTFITSFIVFFNSRANVLEILSDFLWFQSFITMILTFLSFQRRDEIAANRKQIE